MKGVSAAEAAKQAGVLARLAKLPHNRSCADCARPPATWCSLRAGVFLCQRCAGVHRGLGVHVSVVRSTTLDAWLPDQVAFMAATGNAVANAYWEGALPAGTFDKADRAATFDGSDASLCGQQLDAFIRAKYERRQFARGEWPPPAAAAAAAAAGRRVATAAAAAAAAAAAGRAAAAPGRLVRRRRWWVVER